MNKLIKKVLFPLVLIRRYQENYLRKHNPEKLFSIFYKRSSGVYLNYTNPQSMYDKIAYMSFRTNTNEWSNLADKIKVRDYVSQHGYEQLLTKLYGTYENSKLINYSALPSKFVLKTNNASATNIFIKNKNKIDITSVNRQLDKWLHTDYGYLTCQPHYSKIKPMILAEEYLEDDTLEEGKLITDYKFYCVHGKPMYLITYTDRVPNSHIMKRMVYDMDWNAHPEFIGKKAIIGSVSEPPKNLKQMYEICIDLSNDFPFVRIDLYNIKGKIIFGEMTFTPGQQETTNAFGDIIGKAMDISKFF